MRPGQQSSAISYGAHVNYVNTSTRAAWRSDERLDLFIICFTTGEKDKISVKTYCLAVDVGQTETDYVDWSAGAADGE